MVVVADDDDDRRETSEEDTEDKKKRTREDRRGVVVVTKNSVFPARKPVFATTVRMRLSLSRPFQRVVVIVFSLNFAQHRSEFFFVSFLSDFWQKCGKNPHHQKEQKNTSAQPLFFLWMMMMMMRRMLALSNRLHARP